MRILLVNRKATSIVVRLVVTAIFALMMLSGGIPALAATGAGGGPMIFEIDIDDPGIPPALSSPVTTTFSFGGAVRLKISVCALNRSGVTNTVAFVGEQHVSGTGTAFENAVTGTGTVAGTVTGTVALGLVTSTFFAVLNGTYQRTVLATTFMLEGTVTVTLVAKIGSVVDHSETISVPVVAKVAGPAIPTEWTPSPLGIPGVDAYINKAVLVSAVGANAL